MKKDDVGLTILFLGIIALCSICVGVCIKQMFLDVELWIKIIACVGSHFMLLCDVALMGIFIYLIDWDKEGEQ